MAQLTEEVGEVARIIARRYGEQSEKESDKNKDLGEELANVVLCLANQTGVDMQAAFDKKMDVKTKLIAEPRNKLAVLADKIKPKVYEYEFLKE
jgi:NTP pyrophosphatase (non-canonical NTP hydrolase)